jgi:hypothetical protein
MTPTRPRLNPYQTPANRVTGPDPAQTVRQATRMRWGRNGVHPYPRRVLPQPVIQGTASTTPDAGGSPADRLASPE